jgi:hypothetical protein
MISGGDLMVRRSPLFPEAIASLLFVSAADCFIA